MRKKKKSMLGMAMVMAFIIAGLLLPGLARAGDLDPSVGPGNARIAMCGVEDIYNYHLL